MAVLLVPKVLPAEPCQTPVSEPLRDAGTGGASGVRRFRYTGGGSMASLAAETFMEVAAAAVPASLHQGAQEEASCEHDGQSKPQADVQQDDGHRWERERTLSSQIAKMRQKADLLERQTGDIRTGLDDLLNLVERKDVELAHVEGTIRTLRSQMEDVNVEVSNAGTRIAAGSEDVAWPNRLGIEQGNTASAGSSTTTRVRSETNTPGVRGSNAPNSKEMRGVRALQVEAGGLHVARSMVSSQRRSPEDGAAVDSVPAPRVQNSGGQPQESGRRRVVRGSSAPTGIRTLRLSLTPRPASPRIVAAGVRQPMPASLASTKGHEGGRSARSPSLPLCEWMRSTAPDAQKWLGSAQSHPCSRGCTPSRQRPKATWSTPCASCASCAYPVGEPVACWLAPNLLAPPQPQVVVSPGRRCMDGVPQWPLSVRGPVVTQPLATWSGVVAPHGSTSLVPASPLSSVATPCSGCAGLRPPPGLASCPLTLPNAWLQPPSGLGVLAPPGSP